ncbi:MAG: DMT family transporter [Oscillospiraceae bacterium]|nr:DMT family transporter [Oscillospiraceae bacterium]
MKDHKKTALLATAGFATIYGFSFMASRIALQHTSASVLLVIRFFAATLVMLILIAFGVFKVSLRGKPVAKFLVMGICQPVIYFITETFGIQYTNSSFAGVMISIIPITTAILSAAFLQERISLGTAGWIACSIVGVVIISTTQTNSGVVQFKGIIFLLLAVIAASVFYILSKSSSDVFTPFERTFIMMVLGLICFTVQAFIIEGRDLIPRVTASLTDKGVMLPVLYLAVLSSVIAFLLQNYAVTYLELSRITVFENIIPVISVVAGVVFLGEPFSAVQLAGIVLILLGVWKVSVS